MTSDPEGGTASDRTAPRNGRTGQPSPPPAPGTRRATAANGTPAAPAAPAIHSVRAPRARAASRPARAMQVLPRPASPTMSRPLPAARRAQTRANSASRPTSAHPTDPKLLAVAEELKRPVSNDP